MIWLGDSLRELTEFPAAVQIEMGYAIYLAQCGQKPEARVVQTAEGAGV